LRSKGLIRLVRRFWLLGRTTKSRFCRQSPLVCNGIAVLLWFALQPAAAHAHHYFFPQVRERIKLQVETEMQQHGYTCRGEIICGLQTIPIFYQNRDFAPQWFGVEGLRPSAWTLVEAIRNADREGLNPEDYHLKAIEQALNELSGKAFPPDGSKAHQWADLDLMLTDAYLLLGSHLSGGRINPENLHADWLLTPRSMELAYLLGHTDSPAQLSHLLNGLKPRHKGYQDLLTALHDLQEISSRGGWPQVRTERILKPGDLDAGITTLRERLRLSGDLLCAETPAPPEIYDPALVSAVEKFQQRHGLNPDGVIGPKTIDTMNVTVVQRIRQIDLNLERWRWLPRDLGDRYIIINTAAFRLSVMDHGRETMAMRVVVGRPARQSPVFSADLTYMVLNPYWNVPRKLAVEDILPKAKKDAGYLIDHKFKVFEGWDADAQELDPRSIQWAAYSEHSFPFWLRQEPGRENALGRIKFMFPNRFAVYLHDTPQKSLFARAQRDFSSGCIRVEQAYALADYLLSDDPHWTPKKLRKTIEKERQSVVHLAHPIPVHLQYMTAWVDPDGTLQFREDIYQRDEKLDHALRNRTPYPLPPLAASR
jgi:L,D-transpeptidase YcbB